MSPQVVPVPGSSRSKTFELNLRWVHWLGVDLQWTKSQLKLRTKSVLCFSWLLFNIVFNCISIYFRLTTSSSVPRDSDRFSLTQTFSASAIIIHCSMTIQSMALHSGLCLIAYVKWPHLWQTIQNLTTELEVNDRMIQRASRFGLIYVIILEMALLVGVGVSWPSRSWRSRAMMLQGILEIYSMMAVVLYGLLTLIMAACYQAVAKQIEAGRVASFACQEQFVASIFKWKRSVNAISDCWNLINEAFGPVLLVEICSIFVQTISRSFIVVQLIQSAQFEPFSVQYMLKHVIHLAALGTAADYALSQCMKIHKVLGTWTNPSYEQHVTNLKVHIHQSLPEISALGLIPINRKLLPNLIATSLTYVIILYQFQRSDMESKGKQS